MNTYNAEISAGSLMLRESRKIASLLLAGHMSQAVFAHCLNLTVGYVSQLERGAKRPTGAALVLLTVIHRKGIEAIL
jgi:putative transcriptional regulator